MDKPQSNKPVTIYDIAKRANTSIATVSRVLSNSGYPVSEATRQRVLKAVKDLNYTPNLLGRMLKKNVVNEIGVIVPSIQNPFYTEVLIGIEVEAKKNDYDILIYNSFRNVKNERRHIRQLIQKQVKGLIISSVDYDETTLMEFTNSGGYVVLFDQNVNFSNCIKVKYDFMKATCMAVEYLISMGHENIAFLSSPLSKKSRLDNLEGYKLALAQHNITFKKENVIISDAEDDLEEGLYEFENGKSLAIKFLTLKDRPTAIVTVNDLTAFGIIQQLTASGLSVPDEVSIIGFDNIETSKMINPPLTTINQHPYKTGKIAGKLLFDTFNNPMDDANFTVSLDPSIIIRDSVKKA